MIRGYFGPGLDPQVGGQGFVSRTVTISSMVGFRLSVDPASPGAQLQDSEARLGRMSPNNQ